jgi:hypothetical protein
MMHFGLSANGWSSKSPPAIYESSGKHFGRALILRGLLDAHVEACDAPKLVFLIGRIFHALLSTARDAHGQDDKARRQRE